MPFENVLEGEPLSDDVGIFELQPVDPQAGVIGRLAPGDQLGVISVSSIAGLLVPQDAATAVASLAMTASDFRVIRPEVPGSHAGELENYFRNFGAMSPEMEIWKRRPEVGRKRRRRAVLNSNCRRLLEIDAN